MESVAPETKKPRGSESEFTPVPSPRNLSALKMSSPMQKDTRELSDRPDSHHHPDHPTSGALEGGQHNLTALLQEVDYLRQSNKKLREALMSKERDLETLKVDVQLLEQATEAKIAEKSAVLVREVYSAQRERDEAIMARLRLANEERDEALLRVQQLQQYIQQMEDINPKESDMTLQELLDKLDEAEDGADIVQNGDLILDHIKRSQERREQITAEEMGAVIIERDTARAQCKHLEKELHLLRESKQICTDIVTAQKTFDPASKAPVTFLQHNQDKLIEDYRKLEEEIQTLHVYYSLHQSLSQEVNLKEQYSRALNLYDNALKNRGELLRVTQQQNENLERQLREAQCQNSELKESLRKATACQKEMEDKAHKLERLVDVLRKKVGAGSVRTMI
ncbi:mirror-image polydactyly gene 1 protein isoform X1 [Hyla sarda]|uniref:mirror-image polydactyly gene 1 protein isoform X1 n=1 Tax=Hyla sarda TaxID=327740 RepID=UPI0024C2BD5F|nr:mirror-image polydactyly gene 1 protein isoform X1 [Hyla sarda]XP_056401220.1 mirror-image polydactyly gene 1 protein isoform X1 [Hyla sarda]XP_056401221.1 mirror-image polydactyly gene 1 protein isoform X1 [Hyla sarda]XP_056401222.1 mirror-image polydactyly gene 1 protein isoform X1 [Hyla sarda]